MTPHDEDELYFLVRVTHRREQRLRSFVASAIGLIVWLAILAARCGEEPTAPSEPCPARDHQHHSQ